MDDKCHDRFAILHDEAAKANAQLAVLVIKVDQCTTAVHSVDVKLDALEARVRDLEQSKSYMYGIAAGLAALITVISNKLVDLFR